MTNKILISLLGASLVLGLSAPAFAKNDRGRDTARGSDSQISQRSDERQQNARSDRGGSHQKVTIKRVNKRGVSKRQVFQTKYRANIVLTENTFRSRRGPQKVCTVSVRGPQSRYVSKKRLRKIARTNCSRRARIQINA